MEERAAKGLTPSQACISITYIIRAKMCVMRFTMILVVTKFEDYEMSSRKCEQEKSLDILGF
jgi:hypothetical protein